jgi:hypothetical protein
MLLEVSSACHHIGYDYGLGFTFNEFFQSILIALDLSVVEFNDSVGDVVITIVVGNH